MKGTGLVDGFTEAAKGAGEALKDFVVEIEGSREFMKGAKPSEKEIAQANLNFRANLFRHLQEKDEIEGGMGLAEWSKIISRNINKDP